MVKDRALTGAAGEYYVAFRLVAEGFAVGLTPRGYEVNRLGCC